MPGVTCYPGKHLHLAKTHIRRGRSLCLYLEKQQDGGLGESRRIFFDRSCVSPAHVKRIGTLVITPPFRHNRASQRKADNLQTEVSALDYGGTTEFEMVGEIAGENSGGSLPYAASTFAVETSISTDRPRKSKSTRIRSLAGSK